jgi:hypothetical protein
MEIIIVSVNEKAQTHVDGEKAAGAEGRFERRKDEEEWKKTRKSGQDGQLNLVA